MGKTGAPSAEKTKRKAFHFRHISTKLLTSYLLILVLPVTFFGFGLAHFLQNAYRTETERNSQEAAHTLAETMKYTFDGVTGVLSNFCSNSEIWGYFNKIYQYPENSIQGYYTLVRPLMDSYMALHSEILARTMFTLNRSIVTNLSEIRWIGEAPVMEQLMEDMLNGNMLWTVTRVRSESKERLVAAQMFRSYGKPNGLFCLELDQDKLRLLLGEGDEDTSWSVIQPYGEVILSTLPAEGVDALNAAVAEHPGDAGGIQTMDFAGKRHQVFSAPFILPDYGGTWYIIETVSDDALSQVAAANIRLFTMLLASLLILMAILSFVFSDRLGGRLRDIRQGIAEVEQGNFHVQIPVQGEDEVADLATSLNHMTRRLDQLIHENAGMMTRQREMEIASREASLNALQSQINPHFLYNSLEAIQYGIAQGDRDTGHIVQLLAKSLRRLASWEEPTVTLQEELTCIDEYLQIQKYRLGDRLSYQLDIAPGLEQIPLPKLILQPLVENAVSHGIARKPEGGTVTVRGSREGDSIRFLVEDDGEGMDEFAQEELRQILSKSNSRPGKSIGLKNVYERIRLYYGGRASLTWESQPGEYTRFILSIQGEDGEKHARTGH
ncbi:MAG: sensor histidine kinase [Clostridia bacterium]|nr:sensor histidine kinase [Clostridia bacterium]